MRIPSDGLIDSLVLRTKVVDRVPNLFGVQLSRGPRYLNHRTTKEIFGDAVKMDVSEPNMECHSLAQLPDNPLTKLIAMSPG